MYCYFLCVIVPDNQMNSFINANWRDLFNAISPSLYSVWSQMILEVLNGFDKLVPFDDIFPEKLPKWLLQFISNSTKSCHCIRLICVNQQSQNTRKQKPVFENLEICDWPWNWVIIICDSTGHLICLLYRTLLQQVVVWWYVVCACCNQ